MEQDILRLGLNDIALANSKGYISDDKLSKACEKYKILNQDFEDSYEYNIYVTKSLIDSLNNNATDLEISKAVLPGQTKVIDGVMYIYTATPNAKTDFDWRVYNGGKKIGRQITATQAKSKQKYINELFPQDLSSLKIIKKLGGSTGAELVEDDKGNQYVMKKGSNTNNDHVKSEYIANQLYDLLGQRVPDYQLYENNGDVVLLSKYIPLTRIPNVNDFSEMAKGFVVDALLANWDVYQNDNSLIDSAGRVIRVDNGGCLNYRAQGSKKTFGDSVVDFDSMIRYNPTVVSNLSLQDYLDQINEVIKKKAQVTDYLTEIGEDSLAETFKKRFDSLNVIKSTYEAKIAKSNKKILPRNLKTDTEMYRELSEDELNQIWNNSNGDWYNKLTSTDRNNGWQLLSEICKLRGFDARPNVVQNDEYWDEVKKSKYQLFRGVDGLSVDKDHYSDDFKFNDLCYYGSIGIHGSGIYSHVNDGTNNKDNTQTTYKNSDAYKGAFSYSGNGGSIIEMVLPDDSKIADVEDLRQEILSLNMSKTDSEDIKKAEDEIEEIKNELNQAKSDFHNLSYNVEDEVKTKLHWNNDTLVDFQLEIDNTNWGLLNQYGEPEYPDFDTFVKGKMFNWVTSNGGTVISKGNQKDDLYVFKLPNSKESFMISRYQYENNAIKRKNAFTNAYNYPVRRFSDWLMNNHYKVIEKELDKAYKNMNDKVNSLSKKIIDIKSNLQEKQSSLDEMKKPKDPNSDIYSAIYGYTINGNKEAIGVYAAIKGYDAIFQKHGNGGPNTFGIILNRSKLIVKR